MLERMQKLLTFETQVQVTPEFTIKTLATLGLLINEYHYM